MINAILVVVALVAAFVVALTVGGDLSGYFEIDLVVWPLVLGWPLLLCAPLYLWVFRRLEKFGHWWPLPLVGALLFPIPVAVGFLPEVFDPGGVERLRTGLLAPPLIVGVYLNYALFGFILGILYTLRRTRRQPDASASKK
jgi:hypothetical protein